jgi:hypothetical protein
MWWLATCLQNEKCIWTRSAYSSINAYINCMEYRKKGYQSYFDRFRETCILLWKDQVLLMVETTIKYFHMFSRLAHYCELCAIKTWKADIMRETCHQTVWVNGP